MAHPDFDRIKRLIAELESDFPKFYGSKVGAAGVRIRRKLQQVRELSQKIRLEVLARKNKKPVTTRRGSR